MSEQQTDLPLFKADPGNDDVEFLIKFLEGKDWVLAADILKVVNLEPTEQNKRRLRMAAEASAGRIAGGQRGYKLVTSMTHEEYNHWRNAMRSQCRTMIGRIIRSDRVFYRRLGVETGSV